MISADWPHFLRSADPSSRTDCVLRRLRRAHAFGLAVAFLLPELTQFREPVVKRSEHGSIGAKLPSLEDGTLSSGYSFFVQVWRVCSSSARNKNGGLTTSGALIQI